ncbi:MAG: cob(I)yrinic acid a,c-diamide adenosyltransferase [Massilibacteroides sp.]|nr:cob(I)yrinic acid a,c-diamide adenosyltransferase [Massilibacteroides sp.]MDD3061969.1 cob(I)yrinic acid a,c-diamide adenosyltransferase [Massilibacteroides sp.]MDD4115987.1 cob(I)yrinic acid a,c-diamide adenosyltransferase [Massilibacteroides sp.]MDD4659314.1 cob(I)yrinic acid a,c-diamide adenosyltransferase [Massilibacteroides sp.]
MKKSVVYTRTGDKGTTALVGGKRVSKTDPRIESYGTIDELNSFIGLLMVEIKDTEDLSFLKFVQHKLFNIGSYLATDRENTELCIESQVTDENIARIEKEIDRVDGGLPRMTNFVLPGGSKSTALAHICRTVCRRAERCIYVLAEKTEIEKNVLIFVNRLSDYLFVLARKQCINEHGSEIIWDYTCS